MIGAAFERCHHRKDFVVRNRIVISMGTALALANVPTLASAEPAQSANPAGSLSIASVRAPAKTTAKNHFSQGATIGIVLALGVIAGGIIAVTGDDDSDSR